MVRRGLWCGRGRLAAVAEKHTSGERWQDSKADRRIMHWHGEDRQQLLQPVVIELDRDLVIRLARRKLTRDTEGGDSKFIVGRWQFPGPPRDNSYVL